MLVANIRSSDFVYVIWSGVSRNSDDMVYWTVKEWIKYSAYEMDKYEKGDQYLGIEGSTNSE